MTKTLMVTLNLERPDDMTDTDFFDLRREVNGCIISVGGRTIRSPLDVKNDDKLFACFEVSPQMQKAVEDYLHEGLKITTGYTAKIAFEEIDSVIEPSSHILLSEN